MKAALLIGVSEYKDPASNLPGSKKDLAAMRQLVELSGEYEEILALSACNIPAIQLKNQISDWIAERRKEDIEELFFYYSGHGEFDNDEFYFQLYDFQRRKRHQTSLTNSDLDLWLRSISPELTVKVIDACNSGIPYIKGQTSIEKYLSSTGEGFQKCIFMYSSTITQSSYQSDEISDFTRAFIDAVRNHEVEIVKYRDIIEFISDEFENSGNSDIQSPVFVTQAHNTEVFCHLSEHIQQLSTQKQVTTESDHQSKQEPTGLKSIVEEAANQLASKEKALQILTELKSRLETVDYSSELTELYNIKPKVITADSVPLNSHIGQWLAENRHDYFAQPTYRTVYNAAADARAAIEAMGSFRNEIFKPRGQKQLDGFKFTVEAPFEAFQVIAQRRYLSLPHYYCVVTYLVSKSKVIFYFFYTSYREKNWDETSLNLNVTWRQIETSFADSENILSTGIGILSGFEKYVLEQIRTLFNQT